MVSIGNRGHGEDHRLLLQIQPGAGINGVVIGRAAVHVARVFQLPKMEKLVRLMPDIGASGPSLLGHIRPRKSVDVGLDSQRVGVQFAPVWFVVLRTGAERSASDHSRDYCRDDFPRPIAHFPNRFGCSVDFPAKSWHACREIARFEVMRQLDRSERWEAIECVSCAIRPLRKRSAS